MDTDKLIGALIEFYDTVGMPTNDSYLDDNFEMLCNNIKNGLFNKDPCSNCKSKEERNKQLKMRYYHYCEYCGKKLQ